MIRKERERERGAWVVWWSCWHATQRSVGGLIISDTQCTDHSSVCGHSLPPRRFVYAKCVIIKVKMFHGSVLKISRWPRYGTKDCVNNLHLLSCLQIMYKTPAISHRLCKKKTYNLEAICNNFTRWLIGAGTKNILRFSFKIATS